MRTTRVLLLAGLLGMSGMLSAQDPPTNAEAARLVWEGSTPKARPAWDTGSRTLKVLNRCTAKCLVWKVGRG